MGQKPDRTVAVLHLIFSITETNGAYNEHCLPMLGKRDLTICTIFRTRMEIPKEITLFEGDDTIPGYLRCLRAALAARHYDVIVAHSPHVAFLFVVANLVMLGKYLGRSVFNVQNSYQNYKLRNRLVMLPAFACFRRIVCCSEACYESYPILYRWLGRGRFRIVPNSANLDRIDRVLEGIPNRSGNGHFTVASVGRLIDIKNPLTVLRAFQQATEISDKLIYIGEGYLRDALKEAIETLRMQERVQLTGLIPRNQVFEELNKVDLVVSASRGEGLPVAVVEAMACRCPVILSDIAPHREIANGTDIIPLVNPDDTPGFAREIERFRQMSRSDRAAAGDKCRRLVEERYSSTALHRLFDQVYGEVMGR